MHSLLAHQVRSFEEKREIAGEDSKEASSNSIPFAILKKGVYDGELARSDKEIQCSQ